MRSSPTQDGAEALEKLREAPGRFDLLITDVQMPGLDGIALAEAGLAADTKLRVILMSGFADELGRAEHLKAKIARVITKPFTLEQIRSAVKAAWRSSAYRLAWPRAPLNAALCCKALGFGQIGALQCGLASRSSVPISPCASPLPFVPPASRRVRRLRDRARPSVCSAARSIRPMSRTA